VLEFDGGSIKNATGNSYTVTFDSNHSSIAIFKENHVCFNNVKLINLNANYGIVTATNLGLEEEDEITDIIGTGWINYTLDLQNVKTYQSVDFGLGGGNLIEIINANIYRKNNACFTIGGCKNVKIHGNYFDGSLCSTDYQGGTTFYNDSCGIFINECPGAIIENNTITDFIGWGIKGESNNGIIIRNNKVLNCRIENITGLSTNDTSGDGIYMRMSDNTLIDRNTVINATENQVGRCGIVFELHNSGVITNNVVEGYDRGIHVEHTYHANIKGNIVKRCIIPMMWWNCGDGLFVIEGNYFSDEGLDATNPKHDSPFAAGRALIEIQGGERGANVGNTVNCKNTYFINNTIVGTGEFISRQSTYTWIFCPHPAAWIGNVFKSTDKSVNFRINVGGDYNQTIERRFIFINNTVENCSTFSHLLSCPIYNIEGNTIEFSSFGDAHSWTRTQDNVADLGVSAAKYRVLKNNVLRYTGESLNVNFTYCVYNTPSIIVNNILPALRLKSDYGMIDKLYADSIFDNNTIVRSQSWETVISSSNIVTDNNGITYPIGRVKFLDKVTGTITDIDVIKV
jgi:hypothetical protein